MEYVGQILSQCRSISWLVSEVKAFKKRCRRLGDRVRAIEELVQDIQLRGSGMIIPAVSRTLHRLCITLMNAEDLLKKCTKSRFLSSVKYKSEFSSVNEQLGDAFRVLASIPQVNQGRLMHQAFQDFTLDDDDDDWDGGVGPVVPLGHRGVMAPAMGPFMGAAAQSPPVSAMYAAIVEVDGGSVMVAEGIFISQ